MTVEVLFLIDVILSETFALFILKVFSKSMKSRARVESDEKLLFDSYVVSSTFWNIKWLLEAFILILVPVLILAIDFVSLDLSTHLLNTRKPISQ